MALVCKGEQVAVVVLLYSAVYSALAKQRRVGQNSLHSYCHVFHTLRKQEVWVPLGVLLLQMPSSYADKHSPTPQSLPGTVETVGSQAVRNSRGTEEYGMQKREERQ